MAIPVGVSLLDHFAALSDPRQHAKALYPLPEILLLVLSATIAADDFVETTLWGTEHLAFLRRFCRYESGIPSHDTLCDVFAALDPELFKACFLAWISELRDDDPEVIAIDGKTSRRSHDRRKGRNPLHLVSAWACSFISNSTSGSYSRSGCASVQKCAVRIKARKAINISKLASPNARPTAWRAGSDCLGSEDQGQCVE